MPRAPMARGALALTLFCGGSLLAGAETETRSREGASQATPTRAPGGVFGSGGDAAEHGASARGAPDSPDVVFSQPVVPGDQGVGPLELLALSSTCAYATAAADDFTLEESAFISRISWEGVYFAFSNDFPLPDASVRITIFEGREGRVENVVADIVNPSTVKAPHGRPPIFGQNVVYSYIATLDEPVFLRGGRRYWISINVNPLGPGGPAWGWCASPDGNAAETPEADQPWQSEQSPCAALPAQEFLPGTDFDLDADLAFALYAGCDPGDCDCDGVPDEVALENGMAADCNANGVPDACDILFGLSQDCDADGIPDECQLGVVIDRSSEEAGPIGTNSPQTLTLEDLPAAVEDVEVSIITRGDFSASHEWLNVIADDGEVLAELFRNNEGVDCPFEPAVGSFSLPVDRFNDLIGADGRLRLRFSATSTVDPDLCFYGSFVQARVRYAYRETPDCNSNGVPDGCDIATGASRDCNADGVPDECQDDAVLERSDNGKGPVGDGIVLEHQFSALLPAIGDATLTVTAFGDLDSPAEHFEVFIGGTRIGTVFQSVPAECGVAAVDHVVIPPDQFNLLALQGRFTVRLVPTDTVDVETCRNARVDMRLDYLAMDAQDCDANGVLDSCQIAAGVAFDANANGILDLCEGSADFNGDGIISPADLAMLLGSWGADDARFDLDGSGRVDGGDLAALLGQID